MSVIELSWTAKKLQARHKTPFFCWLYSRRAISIADWCKWCAWMPGWPKIGTQPSLKLDEPKSLYSTNTISEVWEKYTFPDFGAVPGSRQMLILQERNMIQGSKQIQTSLSPILVQLKQEKSSFSGFFSQFVMGSSENRANSENLIHTGGLQVPDIGWGCTKSGRI